MQIILILAFAIGCTAVEYEGLRIDMSSVTFNRDILFYISMAMSHVSNHTFPNLSRSEQQLELNITNIKILPSKIEEKNFDIFKFEFADYIYTLKGSKKCLHLELSFDYKFSFLFLIGSGKGSASMVNIGNDILVLFDKAKSKVHLPYPWDLMNIVMEPDLPDIKKRIRLLLLTKFVPEFHKVMDAAIYDFGYDVLKAFRRAINVIIENSGAVLYNSILDVKPVFNNSFLSLGFETNVTVDEYFVRKFYRRMTVPTIYSSADFNVCLVAQLIPDTIEALGKGRYYDSEFPPDIWGFKTGTVKELFPILPSLRERYIGDEKFVIDCEISQLYTVNDLGQRYGRFPLRLRFQTPMHCYVVIKDSAEYVLTVQLFFRFAYQMKEDNQTLSSSILDSELFNFTSRPELPEERREILASHLQVYCDFFKGSTLLSPGFKLIPTRVNEMNYDGYTYEGEEMCFDYTEKRRAIPLENITTTDA